ncbi:MAG: hypothetical protein IKW80_09360 [Thermoguttaceae bacterium]|nr:hypothetical protein [Thermoguttaceae bacterium]
MQYYIALAKRLFVAAALMTVLFAACATQAEEFYVVDSYRHTGNLSTEQMDAEFSAVAETSTGWTAADKDAIWKGSEDCKTVIYIHGNLTDRCSAINDGYLIRQYLNRAIADKNYKLVVWFWNSARTGAPIRQDATNAEHRSQWESFYLARFLQSAPESAEIRLIGYSFGANTVLGACQLLSGGKVYGRTEPGTSGKIQSLLIAPAVPTWSFVYGREKALECQTSCRLTVNCVDTGLKWYRFVTPDRQTEAMGRDGVAGVPASQKEKVTIYNVTNQVGATHALADYLGSTGVLREAVGNRQ